MKYKELKDLTLKEFDQYQVILNADELDTFSLLELFGYDVDKMSVSEMTRAVNKINAMSLKPVGTKKEYVIKGRRFKAVLNLTNLSASQFIDFQQYMKEFKVQEVLSVFMIPKEKTWYGRYKSLAYNKGYDVFEVQEFLYNNFTIGEANELSNAFFLQSQSLLKVMKGYLEKKLMKKKMKEQKKLLKEVNNLK